MSTRGPGSTATPNFNVFLGVVASGCGLVGDVIGWSTIQKGGRDARRRADEKIGPLPYLVTGDPGIDPLPLRSGSRLVVVGGARLEK